MMLKEFFELRCGSSHNIEQEEIDEKYQIQGWAFGGIFIAPLIAFILMKLNGYCFNIISLSITFIVFLTLVLMLFHTKNNIKFFSDKEIYVLVPFFLLLYWIILLDLNFLTLNHLGDSLQGKVILFLILLGTVVMIILLALLWARGYQLLDRCVGNKSKFKKCNVSFIGFYFFMFSIVLPYIFLSFVDKDIYENMIIGITMAFYYYFALVVLYLYSTAHVGDSDYQ